jgi:hypothetical protein
MGDFKYIYHYTNIETLALILKNKTIRFNRLDRVDDISEGESFEKIKLQNFLFVSCWTLDSEESIPLWRMYTNNLQGVRLRLSKDFFNWQPLKIPDKLLPLSHGVIESPIPYEEIFTNDYFILPVAKGNSQFERNVEYNPDYKNIKNQKIIITENRINIQDIGRIASIKSPNWAFQKEYRFILMIFPSFPNTGFDDIFWQKNFPKYAIMALHKGEGPKVNFFDMQINPDVLNSLEITLGPNCSEGNNLIVQALIEKYCPGAVVKKSNLTGSIRAF